MLTNQQRLILHLGEKFSTAWREGRFYGKGRPKLQVYLLRVRKYFLWVFVVMVLVLGVTVPNRQTALAALTAVVNSPFRYEFKVNGVLNESGQLINSSSPYLWLNSGGQFNLSGGTGKTVHGTLPQLSKWRLAYNLSNPVDTDNGYRPQNIFRLVTRSEWHNFRQEVLFKINRTNLSQSSNRNASNGVLFFNRYQDGNNLYYAGVRVDGTAVIKKKISGRYYTMAQRPLYSGNYDRSVNPNLIPTQIWMGLRTEIKTNPDNTVSIKLFVDKARNGVWTLVAEATDDGRSYGGAAILSDGHAGIRTDFMDVELDDYRLTRQ